MLASLIPEGPLHPGDAAAALVVGLVLGILLRRAGRSGALAVPIVAMLVFEWRYPSVAWPSLDGRWESIAAAVFVGGGAALVPGVGTASDASARSVLAIGALLTVPVWAIVPDTEAAVIGGCLVVGAWVSAKARWDLRFVGAVALVPVLGALVGSVGRPARLWPALVAIGVSAGFQAAGLGLIRRRQRAGTPTTVAPGETSSTTTAPAPTTAP